MVKNILIFKNFPLWTDNIIPLGSIVTMTKHLRTFSPHSRIFRRLGNPRNLSPHFPLKQCPHICGFHICGVFPGTYPLRMSGSWCAMLLVCLQLFMKIQISVVFNIIYPKYNMQIGNMVMLSVSWGACTGLYWTRGCLLGWYSDNSQALVRLHPHLTEDCLPLIYKIQLF